MPTLIPAHHLQSPFYHPYLPRERLLNRFRALQTAKLIVVEAPAGYGKSVAVDEFTQHVSGPVAWYPLEWLDEPDGFSFIWNLVRTIQATLPEFGTQTDSILEETTKSAALSGSESLLFTNILPTLLRELEALDFQLWIVLENYHLVHDQTEINQIITTLLKHSLAQIHFIITLRSLTQETTQLPWLGYSGVTIIAVADLAFTVTESQTLAYKLGIRLNQTQLKKISLETVGRPLTQNWLFQLCRSKSAEEIVRLLDGPLNYESLAQELLQQQSPFLRDFLCRTSLLAELAAPVCNALLDINNADTILEGLRDSSFLHRIEGGIFRHSHEIIREFLQQALRHEHGPIEIAGSYMRLGKFYEQQGEWNKAIASYCQGECYPEASRLIEREADSLISATQLSRLASWLGHFPAEWLEQDATLLVYQGIILANQGNPLAESRFLQAKTLFEEQGDRLKLTWLNGELGWLYYLEKKFDRAVQILHEALSEPTLSARLKTRFWHHLSMAIGSLDLFGEAIKYAEQGVELLRQFGTREDKMALTRLFRHLSLLYDNVGRYQETLQILKEAHQLIQALGMGDLALAWVDNQMAETYRLMGRFKESHDYLDEADNLLAKYPQLYLESPLPRYVLIIRGHLYRDEYQYEQAEKLYQQAEQGQPNGVFWALRLVQPGYEYEAVELAQEEWKKEQMHSSQVVKARYQGMLGVTYINVGDYKQAKKYLESAAQTLAKQDTIYDLTTIRMYLAWLYFKTEAQKQGVTCLKDTFKQMAEAGYYNLDIWHPKLVAEMCAQALREGIEPDFVERLATQRLTRVHADPFWLLINKVQSEGNIQARNILRYFEYPPLKARELVNESSEGERTKARLLKWLNEGWLAAEGLLRLYPTLTIRRIEIFLLWICLHGSIERIAQLSCVSKDTVNDHLETIREILNEKMQAAIPSGRGTHAAALIWAFRQKIINPDIEPSREIS